MAIGVYKHTNTGERNGRYLHGMKDTRIYRIYGGIKNRCTSSDNRNSRNYGRKGIKCLWESFEDFKEDMYESYLEHVNQFGERQTTIDRIDVNEHYCKENCRWATYSEQNRNHSKNHLIEINGKSLCVVEWAEKFSIDPLLVYNRLKRGWSAKKALTHPKVPKGKRTI